MAVVEQKLSKVAHPLYADADEDATNNCIRDYFSMSRLTEERLLGCPPAKKPSPGDQTTFPRSSPVERASSEIKFFAAGYLRSARLRRS